MSNKTEAIEKARDLTLIVRIAEDMEIEWKNEIVRLEEGQFSKKAVREIRRDKNRKKLSNDGVAQTDKSKIPSIDSKQTCTDYAIQAHKRAEELYTLVNKASNKYKEEDIIHNEAYNKIRKVAEAWEKVATAWEEIAVQHFCI